jgi:ectoine hydroxylase-related dioxygenase (phytanoyl-CoA dioxygenase family)
VTAGFQEFRVSNDALDDPEELQRRIDAEGYLFFRSLQDSDRLRALRRDILGVCRERGWLQQGTELMAGIAAPARRCTEGDIEYTSVYHEIYKLESFHRAGHWPEVLALMQKVIGGPVLPHPQKIARLWFPQYEEHTTPIHQDFVHFQGTYQTYTCWAPVGDCPRELGGLAILSGSHKINAVHDHHFALGAGGLAIDTEQLDGQWVTTDYGIGDTLVFHSLTVHQALPNRTADRLRISLDNRYQGLDQPIAEHMLLPHLRAHHELTWDEVYRDWESPELQYYWKDLDLKVLPRDESWGARGFEESLQQARQGDAAARHHLTRLIKRDPHTDQARAAAAALSDYEARRTAAV